MCNQFQSFNQSTQIIWLWQHCKFTYSYLFLAKSGVGIFIFWLCPTLVELTVKSEGFKSNDNNPVETNAYTEPCLPFCFVFCKNYPAYPYFVCPILHLSLVNISWYQLRYLWQLSCKALPCVWPHILHCFRIHQTQFRKII